MATGSNNAEVRFGAQIGELKSAMAEASNSVRQMQSQVSSNLGSLNKSFESLTGGLVGVKTAVTAVAAYIGHEVIDVTMKWEQAVIDMSRTLGITTQEASMFAVALTETGNSVESMSWVLKSLQREVRSSEYVFNRLGIATRTSSGAWRNQKDILVDSIETLRKYKEGSERNAVAQEILGRAWMSANQLLKMNQQAMADATADAKAFGLVLGPEGAAQSEKLESALNRLKVLMIGFSSAIGRELTPHLIELANWFREAGPAAIQKTSAALSFTTKLFREVWTIIRDALGPVLDDLGAWFQESGSTSLDVFNTVLQTLVGLLHGAVLGFKILYEVVGVVLETLRPIVESIIALMSGDMEGAWDAIRRTPERMAEAWEKANERITAAAVKTNASLVKVGGTDYVSAFRGGAAPGKGGGGAGVGGGADGLDAPALVDPKKEGELRIKRAEQAMLAEIELEKEKTTQLLAQNQITAEQQLEIFQKLEDRKLGILIGAEGSRKILYDKNTAEDILKRQEIDGKIAELKQKHGLEMLKLDGKLTEESLRNWMQMLATMESSMTGSIQKMFRGQATFGDMLKNLWMAMLDQFIAMQVKLLFMHIKGESAKTAATATGTTARTGIEAAGAATSVGISAGMNIKEIMMAGWTGAANVYKSIAAIPLIGPFLAPTMALASAAIIHRFASRIASAAGGWEVPSDQIAQVHKNEMVLPAKTADKIRNMTEGGGQQPVTVNISAVDAAGVRKLFMDHGGALADSLKSQIRNFNTVSA